MKFSNFLTAFLGIALVSPSFAQVKENVDSQIIRKTKTENKVKKGLLAGPMVSYIDNYSSRMWLLVPKGTEEIRLHLEDFNEEKSFDINYLVGAFDEFKDNKWYKAIHNVHFGDEIPVVIDLQNLSKDSEYNIEVYLDGDLVFEEFTLYTSRSHNDDIYFLFGSSLNIDLMDSHSEDILKKMTKTSNDFMIWGGDNVFIKGGEYESFASVCNSYKEVRKRETVNEFMQSTPHIAIWDKNDYGLHNSNSSMALKDSALMAFNLFWPNTPKKVYNYTFTDYGVYKKYDYEDIDIFMLDDRMFRVEEGADKALYGNKQLDKFFLDMWGSSATFKFIVSSVPFMDENATDAMVHYNDEYKNFLHRLDDGHFEGVVFISANEKKNEVIKKERTDAYPIYELTTAPLIDGDNGNYSRIKVDGAKGSRIVTFEIYNKNGELIKTQKIHESELKF